MRAAIVAIDGPAAAGKSTAGKALAASLGYQYIDTGALYRAVAWLADRAGIADAPGAVIAAAVDRAAICLVGGPSSPRVLVEGCDVSAAIRTPLMSGLSSRLSALPEVRAALLGLQRRLGEQGGVVMDGRDIGTVIFPHADVKFFVTASPRARARRRWAELREKGIAADLPQVLAELQTRDARDSSRDHAPLRAADDAVSIDTTDLGPHDVVQRMLAVVRSHLERRGDQT